MDKRELRNNIADVIVSGLHYIQNYQRDTSFKTAEDMKFITEGGIHRYQNDALFHNQCEMLIHRIIEVIAKGD
jgi:hypothetical protein